MDIKDVCSLIDDERQPIKIYLKKNGSKRLTPNLTLKISSGDMLAMDS